MVKENSKLNTNYIKEKERIKNMKNSPIPDITKLI
jgi:hypothetical protein